MASVFAATHLRNGNRVALKVLHPEFETNSDVRSRFLREGDAANRVQHRGTVRVLDDGTAEDGAVFFVMELLEGETLEARWERRGGRLPPLEVAELMCQVLDVLSAAHERGIVHRDVKPENLFIERDGTVRVLDFGVARVLEGALGETRAGSVIGTLPYMSPEQMLGKSHEVDGRSDVWSVGATAFALVSGRFVHAAETPEEMLVFTASRPAPSLASVAPQVPCAFTEVVDRALRLHKEERWPSAQAMQAAFAEVIGTARWAEKDVKDPDRERGARRDVAAARTANADPTNAPRSFPAAVWVASHQAPVLATIALSSESTMRVRSGLSAVTLVMARAWETRARGRATWLRGRWVRAGVALALAGAVAALTTVDCQRRTTARTTVLAGSALSFLPQKSDSAPASEAVASDPSARSLRPEAPAVDSVATKAIRTAARDGASDAARGPKTVAASLASATSLMADLERSLGTQDRNVGRLQPAACSPPFTIVAATGKKLWKRECP